MKTIVRLYRDFCWDYYKKSKKNIIRLLMYRKNNNKNWTYTINSYKGNLVRKEETFTTLKKAEKRIFKLLGKK